MSHAAYRAALVNIATAEAEGEDVGRDIATVARSGGMDVSNVRQDVTEMADLLA